MSSPESPFYIPDTLPVRDQLLHVATFLASTGLNGVGLKKVLISSEPKRVSWANPREPGLGFVAVLNTANTATTAGFIAYHPGGDETFRVAETMDPLSLERDPTAQMFRDRWCDVIGPNGDGLKNFTRSMKPGDINPESLVLMGQIIGDPKDFGKMNSNPNYMGSFVL